MTDMKIRKPLDKTLIHSLVLCFGALSILLSWPPIHAATGETSHLGTRMGSVRFPSPITAVGETPAQQFTSVLSQISDAYAAKWKQPLPIVFNLEAVHLLARSKTDLNRFMDIPLGNVPLPELLREWCNRANLRYTVAGEQIVLAPAPPVVPE
jgi:hypothetical protein